MSFGRQVFVAAIGTVAMLCCGCVQVTSVTPLYEPESDRIRDRVLLGEWACPCGSVRWSFEPAEHASYLITIERHCSGCSDDCCGGPEEYSADLVKIGAKRYFFIGESADAAPDSHSMPALRVKRKGDRLLIHLLNPFVLPLEIQEHPERLPYEVVASPNEC